MQAMRMSLAEALLESAANPRDCYCKWCKHPEKRIRAKGLCNHCYRIQSSIDKLEARIAKFKARNVKHKIGPVPPEVEWEYKTALKMAEHAKFEGESCRRYKERFSGLDLETEFRMLSKRLLRKDFFVGMARLFDWSFTDTQRALLYYLLDKMLREYRRQHRRDIAGGIVLVEENEKGSEGL
jgi:hypothetical protein